MIASLAGWITRRVRRDERGAIGVLIAALLGFGVLTGMGAMVVDVGQLYQERAELQNGADAAALGVAKSCALGTCDPSVAGSLADANASALTGGSAGVNLVCGSGIGLATCPGGAGTLTSCPPATGATYADVFTSTRTASGSTLLPPVFARTLLGNSGYSGDNVVACSQATWGTPSAATTVAITIPACEWDQATQQGNAYAPPPTYPPNPFPSASFDQVLTWTVGGNGGAGCASEPAGADGPGTFSMADHVRGNCHAAIGPPTFAGRTRTTLSLSCVLVLQAALLNKTPLRVPIYVPASNGGTPSFTLQGFAEFVVTGYNLPNSFFGSDWLNSANDCQGTNYCLNGYFTQGVVPFTGSLNGTYLGASVIELTG
ncbi:MAG: TadE/TadG family type IV pilus assembly protein [Streptosporangiaceae bacterium]